MGLVTMGWLVMRRVALVVAIASLVAMRRLVGCMGCMVTVAMAVIFLLSVSVALFNCASGAHVAVCNIGDGMAPATILVTTLILVEDSEIAFLVLGLFVAVTVTMTMILLLVTVSMAAFLDCAGGTHVTVGDVGCGVAPATVSVVFIVLIEDSAIRFIRALAKCARGEVLVKAVVLVGRLLVIGVTVAVRSGTMGGVGGVSRVGVCSGLRVVAVSQGAGSLSCGLAKLAE